MMILEEVQQIAGDMITTLHLHQARPLDEKAGVVASMSMDERVLNNIFTALKLEDPADADQNRSEHRRASGESVQWFAIVLA